jgi:hypothetical protein
MKRRWLWRALKFAPIAVAFVALVGVVVMSLWNWLMPAIFAWPRIGFWQALGLLILSKILLGGFRGHSGPGWQGHWRGRMMERWEKMTPEEREKFRQTLRYRCGPFGAAAGERQAGEASGA